MNRNYYKVNGVAESVDEAPIPKPIEYHLDLDPNFRKTTKVGKGQSFPFKEISVECCKEQPDEELPKRPLSAYNLFFQLEREKIIRGEEDQNYTFENIARVALIHYKQCRLGKPRRKHRKSHGVISFRELARLIAAKWRNLDSNARQLFEERAAIEKARYEEEILVIMSTRSLDSCSSQGLDRSMEDQEVSNANVKKPAAMSDKPNLAIVRRLIVQNQKVLESMQQIPSVKPCFDATKHEEFTRFESLPKHHFTSVSDTPLPATGSLNLNAAIDMRLRADFLESNFDFDFNICHTDRTKKGSKSSRSDSKHCQKRRNSSSFYPIDDDEKVDIIELNESLLEHPIYQPYTTMSTESAMNI